MVSCCEGEQELEAGILDSWGGDGRRCQNAPPLAAVTMNECVPEKRPTHAVSPVPRIKPSPTSFSSVVPNYINVRGQ